jgi:protein SCO1/2
MRGWALLALARTELSDDALLFVLEELDAGLDPYLIAAAARAVRAYPRPSVTLAPFVMRALFNVRYRDEPISFASYGDYAVCTATSTTAVRELLATLAWLGSHANGELDALEALRRDSGGLARTYRNELDNALHAIRSAEQSVGDEFESCCGCHGGIRSMATHVPDSRADSASIDEVAFEDQHGASVAFKAFFHARPSIVVFFYTRCDNPLKCSLTVTKLGRVQAMLAANNLDGKINTAAITYDPGFDLPDRLLRYGEDRHLRFAAGHRMLRPKSGVEVIRKHFDLGVNFVESLVNRHRIEAYVLDKQGRIAASFERIHWSEEDIVRRAMELLGEK